ncbi:hypothetical protein ACSFA0_22515 [Variovorax sp. LT1P1]|uniref:hypothetical protein n=1 Tax=Variovorax sp. LT1P1 TaxID=3443730 RepID=UPI003F485799
MSNPNLSTLVVRVVEQLTLDGFPTKASHVREIIATLLGYKNQGPLNQAAKAGGLRYSPQSLNTEGAMQYARERGHAFQAVRACEAALKAPGALPTDYAETAEDSIPLPGRWPDNDVIEKAVAPLVHELLQHEDIRAAQPADSEVCTVFAIEDIDGARDFVRADGVRVLTASLMSGFYPEREGGGTHLGQKSVSFGLELEFEVGRGFVNLKTARVANAYTFDPEDANRVTAG